MNIPEISNKLPVDEGACVVQLETIRWNGKPVCPHCYSTHSTIVPKRRYRCNTCKTAYSVTVKTVFHHTHLPLRKWFLAIYLILNSEKDISARQLAKDLDVNRNTAWYINMRIRQAMIERTERELLQGILATLK